jgi:hypothetical protein
MSRNRVHGSAAALVRLLAVLFGVSLPTAAAGQDALTVRVACDQPAEGASPDERSFTARGKQWGPQFGALQWGALADSLDAMLRDTARIPDPAFRDWLARATTPYLHQLRLFDGRSLLSDAAIRPLGLPLTEVDEGRVTFVMASAEKTVTLTTKADSAAVIDGCYLLQSLRAVQVKAFAEGFREEIERVKGRAERWRLFMKNAPVEWPTDILVNETIERGWPRRDTTRMFEPPSGRWTALRPQPALGYWLSGPGPRLTQGVGLDVIGYFGLSRADYRRTVGAALSLFVDGSSGSGRMGYGVTAFFGRWLKVQAFTGPRGTYGVSVNADLVNVATGGSTSVLATATKKLLERIGGG